MTDIKECPICGKSDFNKVVKTKDLTVSHEEFNVIRCNHCKLKITSPRPGENELGRYYQSNEYISHTGKATNLINSAYLLARKFTLSWKYSIAKKYAHGNKLLDYGCGTGEFLNYCRDTNFVITGVEPAEIARQKAQTLNGANTIVPYIEAVNDTQDVITLWHVLEHVPDLNETILKLKEKLVENGTIIIAVPNPSSWDSTNYQEHWAAYDTPRHLWHFSKESMNVLISKHKLKLIQTIPMRLDAYYISLMSEKNKHGKLRVGGMINAIINGFRSNLKADKTGEYSSLIYIITNEI